MLAFAVPICRRINFQLGPEKHHIRASKYSRLHTYLFAPKALKNHSLASFAVFFESLLSSLNQITVFVTKGLSKRLKSTAMRDENGTLSK